MQNYCTGRSRSTLAHLRIVVDRASFRRAAYALFADSFRGGPDVGQIFDNLLVMGIALRMTHASVYSESGCIAPRARDDIEQAA